MSRTGVVAIGTALVVSLVSGAGWSQVGFKATPGMQTTKTEYLYARTRKAMVSLSRLLPDATRPQLDRWQMHDTATPITLCVTTTQALVHCPVCTCPT